MRKYSWIILLLAIGAVGGIIYLYSSNSNPNSDYSAQKSSLNNNSVDVTNSSTNNISSLTAKTPVEKEISTYSTLIKNQKDSNRQGNITITCSVLNNTLVKSGETFSFCDTVGPSTVERGYKTANVIIQGTETKGLGGRKLPS